LSISQPAHAQIREFKITAADGAAGDQFGHSVSISGGYADVRAFGKYDSASSFDGVHDYVSLHSADYLGIDLVEIYQ